MRLAGNGSKRALFLSWSKPGLGGMVKHGTGLPGQSDSRRRASQVNTVNNDYRRSGLAEEYRALLDTVSCCGVFRIEDGHGPSGSELRAGRKHGRSSKTTPDQLTDASDWIG
jgi:hypothetical protein